MIHILSVCTNPEILPVMDRLVNRRDNWTGRRAASLEEAKAMVLEHDFDVVLLGAGTGSAEQTVLEGLTAGKPTRYVQHYGGGGGLLQSEVEGILSRVEAELV